MARVFQIVKKVIGGTAGFIASVIQSGVSLTNRFSIVASSAAPAVVVDASRQAVRIVQLPAASVSLLGAAGTAGNMGQLPAFSIAGSLREAATTNATQSSAVAAIQSLRAVDPSSTPQSPALAASLLGASGSAGNVAQSPATALSARISEFHVVDVPATEIVQVTYNLTRRVGSNAAANLGPQNWTNPNNANGTHDGTNATSAGNLLSAQDFNLELNYANSVSKGDLAITSATLFVYLSVTGDATGLQSTVTISYDVGAGYVVLETITGNFDSLTTPRQYDLTAALNSWTKYDAFKVKIRHQTIIAATLVAGAVDASEVEVVANATQIP